MKGIVLGYYGAGNVGDELMLSCLNQWLAPADYELTAVSEHPEMTQQQHGMPAIANAPLLGQWGIGAWKDGRAMALIRAIRSTDALIIGGGDILKDHLGWRSYSYTADKIGLALLCGKDVMLLNVGIRAPVTGFGRRFLRWMLPRCRLVIVRDEESRSVCEQFGAQSPPCVPDIVAYLPRLSPPAPPVAASKDSSEYLLVCLRSTSNVHGRYELNDKRLDSLAAALDAVASKRNWQVRFTPFQSLVGHDDSHVHRLIAERMTERDRVVIDAQTPPLENLVESVGNASFVVAMRLHAAVLAAAYGRPTVTLPYHQKVTAFSELAGLTILPAPALDSASETLALIEQAIAGGPGKLPSYEESWGQVRLPGT